MAELNETNDIYGLEYEWKLTGLRKVDTGGLNGIVIGTNWKLTGTDVDGYKGDFIGATPFKAENLNTASFTPFGDLTENTVLTWIKDVVFGSPSYWEHINTQILKSVRDTKSPVMMVSENELPWATPSTESSSVENSMSGSY